MARDAIARSTLVAEGFFCLRTPLLPATALDEVRTVDALRTMLASPVVREAIFLASPSLHSDIESWLADPGDAPRYRRIPHACFKYLTRMSTRSTPFGLFATVAHGSVAADTVLPVAPIPAIRRRSRLDHELLFNLAARLNRSVEPSIACSLNPTVLILPTAVHYIERRGEGPTHRHHLVELDRTAELDVVLREAQGQATVGQLASAVMAMGHRESVALRFIERLINEQFLVTTLGVTVTGDSALDALVDQLTDPSRQVAQGALGQAAAALAQLDTSPPGQPVDRYAALPLTLARAGIEPDTPRILQVDAVRPDDGSLGQGVVDAIVEGVELLQRVGGGRPDPRLTELVRSFTQRYHGRSVPLLEVLDPDIGLPQLPWRSEESSPMLAGLPLAQAAERTTRWSGREARLLRAIGESARNGSEWVLTDEDIGELSTEPSVPLTPGAALVTLSADSSDAVARGEFSLLLTGFDRPNGARLLGRFCDMDPKLRSAVETHLRWEEAQDPDAIFAEVVYLPEGWVGNVASRPAFRSYDIVLSGHSGLPFERQIPVSDLWLTTRDGQFELHSHRLGRRVIPRLTSAYNHTMGLALFQFLGMLQYQGKRPGCSWTWGVLEDAPFLPRVCHGRVMLSLARWRIEPAEIRQLKNADDPAAQAKAMLALRARRGLPRWVVLTVADNRLPIDLDNPLALATLLDEIPGDHPAILEELWPATEQLLAAGPEGRFRHEIVVPFRVSQPAAIPRPLRPEITAASRFAPGSEWLYLKLYMAPGAMDQVLANTVAPLSRTWCETGPGRRWHFVRYADSEPHLRWRLSGEPDELMDELWPTIRNALAPLVEQGLMRSVQLDTYEREVSRYGGNEAMHHAEAVFHADSEAVVRLIAASGDRALIAFGSVDRLLTDFGFALPDRLAVVSQNAEYGSIPVPEAELRRQLSARYREFRSGVESMVESAGVHPMDAILAARSTAMRSAMQGVTQAVRAGRATESLERIAGSVVHMHLNRLLPGSPNAHETVIYDWLKRLYRSQMARSLTSTRGAHHVAEEHAEAEAVGAGRD